MPDWSIKIVQSNSGDGAAFVPDLKGKTAGDPLECMVDDLVTWNNTRADPGNVAERVFRGGDGDHAR